MNEVTLPDLGFTWDQAVEMLKTNGVELGLNVLTAIVIFYVGRWVINIVMRGLRKVLQKQEIDKTLETFVCNLIRMVLLVFVIVAAISALGIQTTSFIAVLGAAGLAVGLALQGSLSNFASGVLIVLFRPYKVGDFVEAAGISGSVEEVQILTTVLKTGDNKRVIVPNSQIMDSIITNYSANDKRRIDMVIGVSYADDLDKVRQTVNELVAADDRILDEPACTIAVSELADSSVNFVVRPWVATADYWGVKFDMTEAIKKRFDREGISFPFPQRDVHLYSAPQKPSNRARRQSLTSGSMNDHFSLGIRSLSFRSSALIAPTASSIVSPVRNLTFAASMVSGPNWIVMVLNTNSISSCSQIIASIVSWISGSAERPTSSDRTRKAMKTEITSRTPPMQIEPIASYTGLPVIAAATRKPRANTSPS